MRSNLLKNTFLWSAVAILLLYLLSSVAFSPEASAAMQDDNLINQVIDQYRVASSNWAQTITTAANWLFWTLALIEIAWTGVTLILRNADLGEVMLEALYRVIFIGFFLALLLNGPGWAKSIIDSLSELAGQASAAGGGLGSVNPSDIFDDGLTLAQDIIQGVKFTDAASWALLGAAFLVIVFFALMTAMIVMTMLEIFIVLNAGMILLGFGAFRFTSEYAVKYMVYGVSVGMKLFVMLLLAGIGQQILSDWTTNWSNSVDQALLVVGGTAVLFALIKEVPSIMQSLLNGISFSSGDSLVRTGAAGVSTAMMAGAAGARMVLGATGLLKGTAGVGSAVYEATKLARTQGARGFGGTSARAARNFGSAFSDQFSQRMQYGNRAGPTSGMGHRVAEALRVAEKELKELAEKERKENSISGGKNEKSN